MKVTNNIYINVDKEMASITIQNLKGGKIAIVVEEKKPKKFLENWYKKLGEFVEDKKLGQYNN